MLGLPVKPRLPAGRTCLPALVAELLQLGAALGELVLDVDMARRQQAADAVDDLGSKQCLPGAGGVLTGMEVVVDDLPELLIVEAGEDLWAKASPHDNLDAPGIATPRCVARGPGRSSSGGLHGKFMPGTRLVSDADSPGSWRVSAR